MLLKIESALCKVEEMFLKVGIAVMGIIMILQVVFRLFFKALTWSEELAKYLFVWVVFIGISYGVSKAIHIRLDYFYNKLFSQASRVISIVIDLLCLGLLIFFLKPSLEYLQFECTQNAATIPIHLGYVAAAMPCSIILTSTKFILNIIKMVKTGGKA